jgi:hypothetical protein
MPVANNSTVPKPGSEEAGPETNTKARRNGIQNRKISSVRLY